MDVFIEAAAKHFAKNPTPETTDLILLLGGAIQKQLSKVNHVETQTAPQKEIIGVFPIGQLRGMGRGLIQRRDGQFFPKNEFLWIGNTREKHREPSDGVCIAALDANEAEEMFENAEEKDYENDRDTTVYKEIFCDFSRRGFGPNPDWFGDNKTHFYPMNVPKGYWCNRNNFNENDPTDVSLVYGILKDRVDFYENAPPKVYRCWRAATILVDESGIGSLNELRKCGYTDADISPLYNTTFIKYSYDKIFLLRTGDSDFFQLNGNFW